MKDRVDKSIGIVTLIPEVLVKINPTEPLRFTKRVLEERETDQLPCLLLSDDLYNKII